MNQSTLLASIGSQSALLAGLVGLSYIYAIPSIDQSIIKNETNILVADIMSELDIFFPQAKEELRDIESYIPMVEKFVEQEFQKHQEQIDELNQKKSKKIFISLGILLGVLVFLFFVFRKEIDFSLLFSDTVAGGFSMTFAIGIFLVYSLKQYRPVDTNFVKRLIIEKIAQ